MSRKKQIKEETKIKIEKIVEKKKSNILFIIWGLLTLVLCAGLAYFIFFEERYEFYEIKFDSKGGTKVETQYVIKDKKAVEPKAPINEGYIFEGWYLDDEEYDFDDKVDSEFKLEAK